MMETLPEACRATFAQVDGYLDGDLDASACRVLEAHAAECSRCAEIVARLRRTIGICRDAGHAPLPPVIRARAREAVQRLLAGRREGT